MKNVAGLLAVAFVAVLYTNCSSFENVDAGLSESESNGPQTPSPSPSPAPNPNPGVANAWILNEFVNAPLITGNLNVRRMVETPSLVKDATNFGVKYGFDVRETAAPDDRRVAFVNVQIKDLVSADAFGGGVQTAGAAGLKIFMSNVYIEPNWPNWVDYATTNKDGLVMDGTAEFYAEDLHIKNWNADGAIDNKSLISQFVRFTMEGRGNRGIRFWSAGPHYIVDSNLNNDGGLGDGTIFWFFDCSTVVVNVYNSKFNGQNTLPANAYSCDNGSNPTINYLNVDPRTTGQMHPMFN